MRSSQAESIREPLEQAIKAINDFFESEKKSQESAAEFEKEFDRRAAMPGGTAPAIKVDRRTKKKYEQDVKGGSKSVRNRPKIENYYPWRHCIADAAKELARCSWTTEAEALYRALDRLPTDNGSVDWTQPGSLQEIRAKVIVVATRIREILTACRKDIFPGTHFPELLELRTSVQRLTVGCGRIWKEYKESPNKAQGRGNRWQIQMSDAYPLARDLKESLTLEDFKNYAKEGAKPNGRLKEWVYGSKGKEIPIENFFE